MLVFTNPFSFPFMKRNIESHFFFFSFLFGSDNSTRQVGSFFPLNLKKDDARGPELRKESRSFFLFREQSCPPPLFFLFPSAE